MSLVRRRDLPRMSSSHALISISRLCDDLASVLENLEVIGVIRAGPQTRL